jgi:hypothetical protein
MRTFLALLAPVIAALALGVPLRGNNATATAKTTVPGPTP